MHSVFFDHFAITVRDLEISRTFYLDILGLSPVDRPDFSFPGAWFSIGNSVQLHLIQDGNAALPISGSRALHFAFRTSEIYRFRDHLIKQKIPFVKDIKSRPDGILHLFIKDPDGYFIEIISDPDQSED